MQYAAFEKCFLLILKIITIVFLSFNYGVTGSEQALSNHTAMGVKYSPVCLVHVTMKLEPSVHLENMLNSFSCNGKFTFFWHF